MMSKKKFCLIIVLSILIQNLFATPPARIVSTSQASDELLWQILEYSKNEQSLISVTQYSKNHEWCALADKLQSVPHTTGQNIEHIAQLKPDLVVLSVFNRPEYIEKISTISKKTYLMGEFRSLRDIEEEILKLSKALDLAEVGKKIAAQFRENILKHRQKYSSSKKEKPLILGWNENGSITGSKTLFDELIQIAGAKNIAEQISAQGWPTLNAETLSQLKPDILIMSGNKSQRTKYIEDLKARPYTYNWPALKHDKVIIVPKNIMNATSPIILQAIEMIAQEMAKMS